MSVATRSLLSSQALSGTLRRAFQPSCALPSAAAHSSLQLSSSQATAAAPHAWSHLRHLSSTPEPPVDVKGRRRQSHARRHYERRVVPFSRRELFDVVANVDEYSHFVPWCTASDVTRRLDDRHVIADLSVGFRFLSDKYTSVVTLDPLRSVSVDVPDSSLFEYLITDWTFEKGSEPGITNLTFYVEFAFRNPLYQRVTDLFFEDVVKQMVGAFEKRCHVKYRVKERPTAGILHRW